MAKKNEERKGASKQTRAVIDRVEDEGFAVLLIGEDQKTQVDIPVSLLPAGASDGDYLSINITLDRQSRTDAEGRIKKLQDELKQKSDTSDKKDFKL